MLDLSVIILTYNEELHIWRCLENMAPIAKDIFIIDSYSIYATLDIVREYAQVHILQNKWENNYAKQFNWGLEHANISTRWVLRLDADEYLLPELVAELQEELPALPEDEYRTMTIKAYEFAKSVCDNQDTKHKYIELFSL